MTAGPLGISFIISVGEVEEGLDIIGGSANLYEMKGKIYMQSMEIETPRLRIWDLQTGDELAFAAMAADGSLNDVGFDKDCGKWVAEWIKEAKAFAVRDDPNTEYLAYTVTLKDGDIIIGSVGCSYYEDLQETGITYFIGAQYRDHGYAAEAVKAYTEYFFGHYDIPRLIATVREENTASWKVVEKAGFHLSEKKMYQDLNDEKAEMYRFYSCTANVIEHCILDPLEPVPI